MNSDNRSDTPNSQNRQKPYSYSYTQSSRNESVVNRFQNFKKEQEQRASQNVSPSEVQSSSKKPSSTEPQPSPQPKPESKPTSKKLPPKQSRPVKRRVVGVGFLFTFLFLSLVLSLLFGGLGLYGGYYLAQQDQENDSTNVQTIQREVTTVNVAEEDSETVDVVSQNLDAVVSIVATQEFSVESGFGSDLGNADDTQTQRVSAGTGFFARENGFGITNRHVVENKELDYVAVLFDGRTLPVDIVARDDVNDIAFFQVRDPEETFSFVELGSSNAIQPGQSVVAIGYSLGEFSNTVSKGVVSGLDRAITAQGSQGSQRLEGVIQTDASINSGNSGGPLFDLSGNVVGVNVARAGGGENIGFAIPIDAVRPLLDSVLETGNITHPFLGVRYRSLNPAFSREFDIEPSFGAYIVSSEPGVNPLVEGAPAEQAGVLPEDVIVGINDEEISGTKSLQSVLRTYQAGERVVLKIWRNGQNIELQATLGERVVAQ